jgi:hypothetical protein
MERMEQMLELSILLENNSDGIRMEDLNEEQIDQLLNLIGIRGNSQSNNN